MFEVNDPGKKIRKICKALGDDYTIRVIDCENVIYRDLGNGYDFEVSGLDNRKTSFSATLYIWDNRKNVIVETISDIRFVEDLKSVLERAVAKYQSIAEE